MPAEARPVIRSISASRYNTCVVRVNTLVSWWGDNAHGQLTDGIGLRSTTPLRADLVGSMERRGNAVAGSGTVGR